MYGSDFRTNSLDCFPVSRDKIGPKMGIYGSGVFTYGFGLLVDYRRYGSRPPERLEPRPLFVDEELAAFVRRVSFQPDSDYLLQKTVVLPITPPIPYLATGPGDLVYTSVQGRLGPCVRWGSSSVGVLTAGHVGGVGDIVSFPTKWTDWSGRCVVKSGRQRQNAKCRCSCNSADEVRDVDY